jgi:hypothetical protein
MWPIAWWLFLFACALGALGHTARAYVDELALGAGADMLRYARADQIDAHRTIVVNGLHIRMTSGGTGDSPRRVLDLFHARCRARGIRLDANAPPAIPLPPRWPGVKALPLDGVLRLDDGERGYVACLDLGGRRLSPDELLDRTRRFLADGDLAHFGELRFAIAERDGDRTSYLALWSEGALPLREAFPADRDAPGQDPAGVPRVPGTRRVLSAWQLDAAPMLAVYRAPGTTVASLATRYRRTLEAAGFRVRSAPEAARGLVASRGDAWFLIALEADGADAIAAVTSL